MSIRTDDIIFICGKRSGGKSYWLKTHLLPRLPRWILYDYKWEYNANDFHQCIETRTITATIDAYNKRVPHVIYKATQKDPEHFEQFCETIYKTCNITIVIEEVDQYATPYYMPQPLRQLIDVGRLRGLGLICTARRTHRVNPNIPSNANHLIIFRQIRPEDLKYVAEYTTEPEIVMQLPNQPMYYWVWYSDREGKTYMMPPVGAAKGVKPLDSAANTGYTVSQQAADDHGTVTTE